MMGIQDGNDGADGNKEETRNQGRFNANVELSRASQCSQPCQLLPEITLQNVPENALSQHLIPLPLSHSPICPEQASFLQIIPENDSSTLPNPQHSLVPMSIQDRGSFPQDHLERNLLLLTKPDHNCSPLSNTDFSIPKHNSSMLPSITSRRSSLLSNNMNCSSTVKNMEPGGSPLTILAHGSSPLTNPNCVSSQLTILESDSPLITNQNLVSTPLAILDHGPSLLTNSNHVSSPLTISERGSRSLTNQNLVSTPLTIFELGPSPLTKQNHVSYPLPLKSLERDSSLLINQNCISSPLRILETSSSPLANPNRISSPLTILEGVSSSLTNQRHISSPLTIVERSSSPLKNRNHISSPLTSLEHGSSPLANPIHISSPLTILENASSPLTSHSSPLTILENASSPLTSHSSPLTILENASSPLTSHSSPLTSYENASSPLTSHSSPLTILERGSPLTNADHISSVLTTPERGSSPLTNTDDFLLFSSGGCAEVYGSTSSDNILTDNLVEEGQLSGQFKSASWMNINGGEKEGNQAVFDRVVEDAPQRAHIRLKPRHHRTNNKNDNDISSDSSSYNTKSPPALNLSEIGTKPPEVTLESEGSSESGTFFRPAQTLRHQVKVKHSSKKRHDTTSTSMSDAGIVTCSSYSSKSQSQSCSISRASNSSQDAGDSGMVSRNSGNSGLRKASSKRSLAGHYQALKRSTPNISDILALVNNTPITTHLKSMPAAEEDGDYDCDRKRRRFNRTFGALRQCGLLDLTLQTAALMETSQRMQKQIETLRNETKAIHDTMFRFSEQPNILSGSRTQQVMTNLGEMANSPLDDTSLANTSSDPTDSTSQISKVTHNAIQRHHQQRIPVMHSGYHQLTHHPSQPVPKKQKDDYNSVCSSQTLTSTENSSPTCTTDSDEIQKRLKGDGYKEQLKL